jgi:hypothetical protein
MGDYKNFEIDVTKGSHNASIENALRETLGSLLGVVAYAWLGFPQLHIIDS